MLDTDEEAESMVEELMQRITQHPTRARRLRPDSRRRSLPRLDQVPKSWWRLFGRHAHRKIRAAQRRARVCDFDRAGDMECPLCGVTYSRHPAVPGYEWLHRSCGGELLKL